MVTHSSCNLEGKYESPCSHSIDWLAGTSIALLVLVMAVAAEGADAEPFAVLESQGLKLPDASVELRHPSIDASLDPSQRRAVVEQLAGRLGSRFSSDSVSAPVAIDIETIKDSLAQPIGHDIRSDFVAFAQLSNLREREMLEQLFGPETNSPDEGSLDGFVSREVPDDVLQQAGVQRDVEGNVSYIYLEIPLLKKVLIRGVVRVEKRVSTESIELVWFIDPRFASAGEYANRWTELVRDPVGKLTEGKSHAYSGWGGWVGVYQVDPEIHMLLVQSQMVMHEPQQWFSGSNLLRSKLPLTIQENARTFRRKLRNNTSQP
jgi:hypothetical protein